MTDIPQPATQEAVHPSVQQPDETARIEPVDVTAWDLSRFPKVYEQRQRVHIVRWGKGMVMDVDDLKAGRKGNINPTNIDYERLPLDCKFLIVISLGLPNGGCLSTVPEVFAPGPNLTKVITSGSNGERRALEFTVAEPLTDLDCDFKAGVWNCVLSPSEYFKMKEREREHYKEMEEQERRLEKKQ